MDHYHLLSPKEENVALDHSRSATLIFDPVTIEKMCFNIIHAHVFGVIYIETE